MSRTFLDEIFGDDPKQPSAVNNDLVNHDIEKRPDIWLWLPISRVNSDVIPSIDVTNRFDIIIETKKYGLVKARIQYTEEYEEIKIDWDNLRKEINSLLRERASDDTRPIEQTIFTIINSNEERIQIFINGIANNRSLDSIKEFLKNEDESDASDVYDAPKLEILNVSRALKLNSGQIKVKGSIISVTESYKLIKSYTKTCQCGVEYEDVYFEYPQDKLPNLNLKCVKCKRPLLLSPNYVNAIPIELQDDERMGEMDRLNCILVETDMENIHAGESVIITGSIHILSKNHKGNLIPVLFSYNKIEFQNDKSIDVTQEDVEAIRRFAKVNGKKIIRQLLKMYDATIIGQEIAKQCMLLSLASSGNDLAITKANRATRIRINSLLVGPPGLAKSALLKKAVKLIPNARYESSQSSSGKSLTAIVNKENEQRSLNLGPIPLARDSVCALNEIGTLTFSEQNHLLDVMEEGEFTVNKHGMNAQIKSPTTIVASCNFLDSKQFGGSTNSSNVVGESIELRQIPLTRPVLDRFDLVLVMREDTSEEALIQYMREKTKTLTMEPPNYDNFLRKYIQYARQINPTLSDESIELIQCYYVQLKSKNPEFGSKRMLETIIRICKAISRLKLKKVVDAEDTREAQQFYNAVITKYIENLAPIPNDPAVYTYEECLGILELGMHKTSYLFDDLIYEACRNDKIIKVYLLGANSTTTDIDRKKLKIDKNRKVRRVMELLLRNKKVKKVNAKPLTLQYYDKSIPENDW
jgi:replicative DNA helicase Mcm